MACLSPAMRRLPLALACMLACSGAAAQSQETGTALKVNVKGGDPQYFMLASKPVISFDGEACEIKSPEFSAKYLLADIDYAEFVEHDAASVAEIESSFEVDLRNPDYVVIRGMKAGGAVTLCGVSGMVLASTKADGNGTATLGVGSLQSGVYILTTNETTFKIYKP